MERRATTEPAPTGSDRAAVNLEPISVRIPRAVQLTGISRSRLYELIASGQLEVTKVGRSTLVIYRSLRRLIERD